MAAVQIECVLKFHIGFRVTLEEMATWSPRRIELFFQGIAKAEEAVAGPRPIAGLLTYDPAVQTPRENEQ